MPDHVISTHDPTPIISGIFALAAKSAIILFKFPLYTVELTVKSPELEFAISAEEFFWIIEYVLDGRACGSPFLLRNDRHNIGEKLCILPTAPFFGRSRSPRLKTGRFKTRTNQKYQFQPLVFALRPRLTKELGYYLNSSLSFRFPEFP